MASESYLALLRDPRWQEMRLRVMDADGFRCRWCGNKNQTLNVHHTYYRKGAAPWDYPADSLVTLCQDCHEKRGEPTRLEALRWMGVATAWGIETEIIAYIRARVISINASKERMEVSNYSVAIGVAWALQESVQNIIDKSRESDDLTISPLDLELARFERYRAEIGAVEDHYEDTLS